MNNQNHQQQQQQQQPQQQQQQAVGAAQQEDINQKRSDIGQATNAAPGTTASYETVSHDEGIVGFYCGGLLIRLLC
ncbi:hypothetical protein I4U23_031451 [Adineta vaga]|nr:hypothetical protein I4U23_031451 [Adineta vaga]